MAEQPQINCGVVKGVLALLQEQNVPKERLLKAAGLDAEDLLDNDSFVPLQAFAEILEEAARITGDKTLALHLSREFDHIAAGLIGYAASHAPTLRHCLNTLNRYSSLILDLRTAKLTESGGIGYNNWSYWQSFGDMRQYLDWSPCMLVLFMKAALGQQWTPLFVTLEHSAPEDLAPYVKLFGQNVQFEQPENCVALSSADLDREMPRGDERLWSYLVELADTIAEHGSTRPGIYESVRKEIIKSLSSNATTIETIAKSLGKSVRNLQRDLSASGTSFSEIMEKTRMDMAKKYLLETNLNISQIAFLLGFSDLSSFSRAMTRWCGESPRTFRQRMCKPDK